MKIRYTRINFILFLLFIVNISVSCSEKNWFESKVSNYVEDMLSRHTYNYGSFKHLTSNLALLCLPSSFSLYALYKQRDNMIKFLRKNEAEAIEEIRNHFNVDQEAWSKIIEEVQQNREFNISALKSAHNYNAYHDPNLPVEWVAAIKDECKRHNFNINNLELRQDEDGSLASARLSPPDIRYYLLKTYKPAKIRLNRKKYEKYRLNYDDNSFFNDVLNLIAAHEMMHIAEQHSLLLNTIIFLNNFNLYRLQILFKLQEDKLHKIEILSASKKYKAAQEKIADTLLACTDVQMAKCACYTGYTDNLNDIKVINTNWNLTQMIEKRKHLYQHVEQKRQEFKDILKKCWRKIHQSCDW